MDQPEELIARAKADLIKQEAAESRALEALERAREEQIKLRAFIEMLGRYAGVDASQVPAPQPSRVRASRSRELVDKAIDLIRSNEHPLGIGVLADQIEDAGLEIGGQNRNATLAGYLSRDPRVKYLQGIGWTVTEQGNGREKSQPKKETAGSAGNERPAASVTQPTSWSRYNDLDDDIPF